MKKRVRVFTRVTVDMVCFYDMQSAAFLYSAVYICILQLEALSCQVLVVQPWFIF